MSDVKQFDYSQMNVDRDSGVSSIAQTEPETKLIEEVKVDDDKSQPTETIEEVKVESEGEEKDHKPWLSKKSERPPVWAQERFREFTTNIKTLKQELAEERERNKQFKTHESSEPELKESDFPDKNAYDRAIVKQDILKEIRQEQEQKEKASQERAKVEQYNKQLEEADRLNIEKAKADLEIEGQPTYEEAMKNAVPIELDSDIVDHLSISPAGAYVKYRLATDIELAYQVKNAQPQEQKRIIAQLHDSILDVLEARKNQPPATPVAPVVAQTNASVKQPARPLPKAPPKLRGSSTPNAGIRNLGDDYARARNSGQIKR